MHGGATPYTSPGLVLMSRAGRGPARRGPGLEYPLVSWNSKPRDVRDHVQMGLDKIKWLLDGRRYSQRDYDRRVRVQNVGYTSLEDKKKK